MPKKVQVKKIQAEEAAMALEVVTAKIGKIDILSSITKAITDISSVGMNAQHAKRVDNMTKLTIKKIRMHQQRIHSTKMKFTTRVLLVVPLDPLTAELLEVDIERVLPEVALEKVLLEVAIEKVEVANPTMMKLLVIKASEANAPITKRMKKIKTRVVKKESPGKTAILPRTSLQKILKKRLRLRESQPKRRSTSTTTTSKEVTTAIRSLTGRERVEISRSLASTMRRTMLRDLPLRSSRLSKRPRRETWQRHK